MTAQQAKALMQQYLRASTQPLHSCILGGTYSTLALMQAKNGRSPDTVLGMMAEVELGNESYAFMDFRQSNLPLEVGRTYCYQGDQAKAMSMLEQRVDSETLAPKISQSAIGRVETINVMALASLKAKDRDMHKVIHLWVATVEGAKTIKSEERFTEALATYELMETVWPDEPRIKNLRDHIVHWPITPTQETGI